MIHYFMRGHEITSNKMTVFLLKIRVEEVREAKPYLQPNLTEGSELHSRLLPRGELSFVTKIKTKQSTRNEQQIKMFNVGGVRLVI